MAETIKVTAKKLSESCGVSAVTIYEWAKKGIISAPVDGSWDWPDVNIAALKHFREKKNNLPSSLADERTRLTRLNADRRALENEKARGDAIETVKAMKLWSVVMMNIRNKLEIIPAKLPPLVFGLTIPEIKAAVEKMLFEVRSEIANPDLRELAKVGGWPGKFTRRKQPKKQKGKMSAAAAPGADFEKKSQHQTNR